MNRFLIQGRAEGRSTYLSHALARRVRVHATLIGLVEAASDKRRLRWLADMAKLGEAAH
jgi:hypothetical protein